MLLAAGWLVLCRPWFMGGLIIPWDSKDQFYPFLHFVAESLRNGDSPFWNPYIYGGYPMVSDPQSMMFSPLALALALIPARMTPHWLDFIELSHLLIGAVGMLLVCRRSGWSPLAGLYGAFVFLFGGSAAARLQHVPMILAYSYFPFALWTLQEALDTKRMRWAVAFGIVAGVMAAHQNQVAYLLSLTLIGYAAWRVLAAGLSRNTLVAHGKVLAVGGATGILVLAVPLFATLQFLPLSNRSGIPYDEAVTYPLHPLTFLTFFVRDFFANSWPQFYWGFGDITESYLYVGILPVVLIAGYGIPRGLLFAREFRFYLLAGVLGILYAVGKLTPFYWVVYHSIPGVGLYRRPPDATFVINIMFALATAFLVHQLLQNQRSPIKWHWVLGEIFVLTPLFGWGIAYASQKQQMQEVIKDASLALAWIVVAAVLLYVILTSQSERNRALLAWAGLFLLVMDLGVYNAGTRLNAHEPQTAAMFLDDRPQEESLAGFLIRGLNRENQPEGPYRVDITYAGSLWANGPMVFGIRSTQGYDPLRYSLYQRVAGAQAGGGEVRPFTPWIPGYNSPMLDLLGVRFIASAEDLDAIDPGVDGSQFPLVLDKDGIRVWENPRVLPRVLTAVAVRLDADAEQSEPAIDMQTVDFRSTVVLEHLPQTLPSLLPGADSTLRLPGQGEATARLLEYRNTYVLVSVETERDIILVLNDPFYPYWRVYVDGQEQELLRADYLFRGAHVRPGAHQVAFRFEPFSWPGIRDTFAGLR